MGAPYVQTFTPVIGSLACNARCPYCCSRMTCTYGMTNKEPDYDWESFDIAAQIARERQCITAFITSKGEPTLFPSTVNQTVIRLKEKHHFPIIELQTNGILFSSLSSNGILKAWKNSGLNIICLSTVHWDREVSRGIYGPSYPDLSEMTEACLSAGLKIRVSCVMLKGYVDSFPTVEKFREECTKLRVDQLTIRPVSVPYKCCDDNEQWRLEWIKKHEPDYDNQKRIYTLLESNSSAKRNLAHGAKVYSIQMEPGKPDVNICLSNCFTPPTKDEEIRQIIWLPNGRITDNWDHEGLIIL